MTNGLVDLCMTNHVSCRNDTSNSNGRKPPFFFVFPCFKVKNCSIQIINDDEQEPKVKTNFVFIDMLLDGTLNLYGLMCLSVGLSYYLSILFNTSS